jgi:hypothetical protein
MIFVRRFEKRSRRRPRIVTSRVRMQSSAKRIDRVIEDRGQRKLERRVSEAHDAVTGSGWICCATARAY